MLKKSSASNVEAVERRKHWRDRRVDNDRRNPERLRLVTYDCRSGVPRREADVAGELSDGDVWWNKKDSKHE
ncbi:MAG: hypothetical protein COA54_04575 [Thiotrichaceae bacterium]|nr:MAG: hypothetical protein COA54_04575 [Thiotrichaceae bacterium]